MRPGRRKSGKRGPGKRLSPNQVAVATALNVRDFAALYGVSPAVVRGWVTAGLPVLRFPGKLSVLRVEGGEWIERRFRAGRVERLVDEILKDLT